MHGFSRSIAFCTTFSAAEASSGRSVCRVNLDCDCPGACVVRMRFPVTGDMDEAHSIMVFPEYRGGGPGGDIVEMLRCRYATVKAARLRYPEKNTVKMVFESIHNGECRFSHQ